MEVEGRINTVQDHWGHARSVEQKCLNIINDKGKCFTQLQTVLDNLSRKLHKQGVGASKIRARLVTDALLQLSRSLGNAGLDFF